MGGSGGGGRRYYPKPAELRELIDQAGAAERQQRLDGDVNAMLRDKLATFNDRNSDLTNKHIDDIAAVLQQGIEVDRFLMGGSVAKHTYVDGLSDVDALVVLDRGDLRGKGPQEVLDKFHDLLNTSLPRDVVQDVHKGDLAVTVTYRDGSEIQLLPAIRTEEGAVAIPDAASTRWNRTNPKEFQSRLTDANQKTNGLLVPTIKLVKSIISEFPNQKKLSGYHVEALAIEAIKGYVGPMTLKGLLPHVLGESAKLVLRPIKDVTGQSEAVDEYLGKAQSLERRMAADALGSAARKMNAAESRDQWERLLSD